MVLFCLFEYQEHVFGSLVAWPQLSPPHKDNFWRAGSGETQSNILRFESKFNPCFLGGDGFLNFPFFRYGEIDSVEFSQ